MLNCQTINDRFYNLWYFALFVSLILKVYHHNYSNTTITEVLKTHFEVKAFQLKCKLREVKTCHGFE